jgi:hypothetical protein
MMTGPASCRSAGRARSSGGRRTPRARSTTTRCSAGSRSSSSAAARGGDESRRIMIGPCCPRSTCHAVCWSSSGRPRSRATSCPPGPLRQQLHDRHRGPAPPPACFVEASPTVRTRSPATARSAAPRRWHP